MPSVDGDSPVAGIFPPPLDAEKQLTTIESNRRRRMRAVGEDALLPSSFFQVQMSAARGRLT
jgi:hypothetical protein